MSSFVWGLVEGILRGGGGLINFGVLNRVGGRETRKNHCKIFMYILVFVVYAIFILLI